MVRHDSQLNWTFCNATLLQSHNKKKLRKLENWVCRPKVVTQNLIHWKKKKPHKLLLKSTSTPRVYIALVNFFFLCEFNLHGIHKAFVSTNKVDVILIYFNALRKWVKWFGKLKCESNDYIQWLLTYPSNNKKKVFVHFVRWNINVSSSFLMKRHIIINCCTILISFTFRICCAKQQKKNFYSSAAVVAAAVY